MSINIWQYQNRRGLRKDLPQPLLPGELVVTMDTAQVFIGMDKEDPHGIRASVIETYESSAQANNDANSVIAKQLVQIDLSASTTIATIAADFGVPQTAVRVNDLQTRAYVAYDTHAAAIATSSAGGQITSVSITNAGGAYTSNINGVTIVGGNNDAIVNFTVSGGAVTGAVVVNGGTGYVAGITYHAYLPIPLGNMILPTIGYGTAQFFSMASGLSFSGGEIDCGVSGVGYDSSDVGIITVLINLVHRYFEDNVGSFHPGLVKLVQTIELLTEYTAIPQSPSILFDEANHPVRAMLNVHTGAGAFNVPNATFSISESDSIVIDYSLSDGAGYNRVGVMHVSATSAAASIVDTCTEVNPLSKVVTFSAAIIGGNQVSIQYHKPFTGDVKMSMVVRRWLSNW